MARKKKKNSFHDYKKGIVDHCTEEVLKKFHFMRNAPATITTADATDAKMEIVQESRAETHPKLHPTSIDLGACKRTLAEVAASAVREAKVQDDAEDFGDREVSAPKKQRKRGKTVGQLAVDGGVDSSDLVEAYHQVIRIELNTFKILRNVVQAKCEPILKEIPVVMSHVKEVSRDAYQCLLDSVHTGL